MRVHVVNVLRPEPETPNQSVDRFTDFSRQVEERGFAGLWVTDSFGRGRPTLDPIVLMSVIAAVTRKVEIGTCVLQVPVRHPIELAHRIQSLHALTGKRLQLGLGCGSTQADFDLVGEDYEQRFKNLMPLLHVMQQAWRGEPIDNEHGKGALTPWPIEEAGGKNGPDILLGAWRNKRWITYSAGQCAGWIASGLYPTWEELERGIEFYRNAGGKRAVLSNVIIDLKGDASDMPLGGKANVMLTGDEARARETLRRIQSVGFDDVLCMARPDSLDDLSRLRDAL